ncbi:MAG: GAF domain-containing protein, partial [Chloroflexi bacterium]|nr:GAF domain-containing protein [Chloroflexota bacterium]
MSQYEGDFNTPSEAAMPQDKKKFRQKTGEENLDHLRYLEKMDQINRAMQGTNDLEQVMKDVLDTLLSVFDCDRAWLVYPCDPQASTWQTPMERTRPEYPGVLPIGVELPLDPVGAEVYRKLRNVDGPVKFGPGSEYPVPLEIAGAFKVQSFIAMAFYPKIGKAWSFGLHQCSFARVWTPQEERLFQEIGRRLSDTLTSLLAFRNLRESEAQIRQLIDASPLPMVVSSGLEEHVEWVNDKFIELFGYTIEDMPDVEHWWPLAYPDPEYREAIKSEWEEKARKAIQDKGQIEPMEAKVTCKDGSIRFVEFQFSSIGEQHLITFVDFTERKRAEVEIQALAKFPSENPNPVLRITHDGILLYANRASAGLLRCWNCSIGKVLPRPWRKLILEALDSGLPIEKEMVCEDRVFALMLSPIVESNYVNLYGRDITERKQAEQELVVREREYRTLLKNIPDLIVRYDANLRRVYVNPAWERASGLSAAEVVNVHPADLPRVPNPIHKEYLEKLQYVLTTGTAQSIEFTWVNANGTTLFLDYVITPEYDRSGKISGVLSVGRDITERKRNEAINAARLHLIQFSLTHSLDELLEETLNEAEKLTGSLIGFYHFIDDNQKNLTLQDWSTRTKAEFCKAEGKGLHYAIDEAGVWADCVRERKAVVHNDYASLPNCKGLPEGHAVVLRELVVPVFRGEKISAILGVGNKPADYTGKDVETISHLADLAWEIAERKRAEEAQHRLNRELRAISNCNQTLMRAVEEQALLNDICRIVCDEAGYRMAWVGYPEHDEASTVRPAAWAGVEDGYLAAANITWADTERGRGPSGTAIRSGRSACIQDFATDPQAALWREAALQRGYRSNIALPLKDENANTFGALTIYSMEPNAFTLEERRLLEELAGDLAFGITVLRARAEHKRVEGQLQKSEARFRSFVEKANDIIFTVSPEGIFTYVSPNWKELLGHDVSEVEGKSFESFIHPDDLILCRNVLNRAVVSGENQS